MMTTTHSMICSSLSFRKKWCCPRKLGWSACHFQAIGLIWLAHWLIPLGGGKQIQTSQEAPNGWRWPGWPFCLNGIVELGFRSSSTVCTDTCTCALKVWPTWLLEFATETAEVKMKEIPELTFWYTRYSSLRLISNNVFFIELCYGNVYRKQKSKICRLGWIEFEQYI